MATVEAYTKLVCLGLKRDTFTEILGPLEQIMAREKSPQVVAQKMAKLQPRERGEFVLKIIWSARPLSWAPVSIL